MTQQLSELLDERVSQKTIDTKSTEGQEIEKKYGDKVLKEFEKRIGWFESEVGKQIELVLSDHVPKLYDDLRRAEVTPKDARAIIVGRLIHYRAERTIVKYLPDEPKDKRQQDNAKKSNESQAKQRDEKYKKMVEEEAIKKGKTHAEAKKMAIDALEKKKTPAEAGKMGAEALKEKYEGTDHWKKAGREGGLKRAENRMREQAVSSVNEDIVNEVTSGKEITVKIPRPDPNNEDETRSSIKIEYLWYKYGVAYLSVDQKGNIVRVFNADMETQEESIKRMEEPIETSN
jgi:hypothetical protein